jgi:hypothetical protein
MCKAKFFDFLQSAKIANFYFFYVFLNKRNLHSWPSLGVDLNGSVILFMYAVGFYTLNTVSFLRAFFIRSFFIRFTFYRAHFLYCNFYLLIFLLRKASHILRFDLYYTVIVPAAPQETVGKAGSNPELLRCSLVQPIPLANWATTW